MSMKIGPKSYLRGGMMGSNYVLAIILTVLTMPLWLVYLLLSALWHLFRYNVYYLIALLTEIVLFPGRMIKIYENVFRGEDGH